ncbi:hypothetical protein MKZ38_004887 [Zalerion maritima]|uniref:PHD and RING finger domain-containing protein n=1 Tax=Zalerion maritima TaxID=339359 RepID=A0AAD5WUX0_9PEZI|nr:hypothetical protein MKZ38_004887 [Zalerion maritima]
MTDSAEQCIICLENLDGGPPDPSASGLSACAQPEKAASDGGVLVAAPLAATTPNPAHPAAAPEASTSENAAPFADLQSDTTTPTGSESSDNAHHANKSTIVAVLEECGHQLHNECLRAWTAKANSCPICRQSFNIVNVFDRVGGTKLSTYLVADKKQTFEWDPTGFIFEEEEEDEAVPEVDERPCVVCESSGREELLLLCDNCNAPYHSDCVGLELLPRGEHWYCIECEDFVDWENPQQHQEFVPISAARSAANRSHFFPRTRGAVRRARYHARGDPWRGAWGQFTESVYEALDIDLDYHDTEDDDLEVYRRAEQLREREHREYERWQQRLNIATRAGARDVFQSSMPNPHATVPSVSDPPRETREEIQAWRDLERAKDQENERSSRKRRASPDSGAQSEQQPERKLKRPRTRRLPHVPPHPNTTDTTSSSAGPSAGPSALGASMALPLRPEISIPAAQVPMSRPQPTPIDTAPTFLSSLLQEIKTHPMSDEGNNARGVSINGRTSYIDSSPASSPSPSAFSSPAMPASPGPVERPISPTVPLRSHIAPKYPPANYRPNAGHQHSDSEAEAVRSSRRSAPKRPGAGRSRSQDASSRPMAIRNVPRVSAAQHRSERQYTREGSPTLPLELKESISCIVRGVLKPHWRSKQLTSKQYETINRDVSRKLYNDIAQPGQVSLDDAAKQMYERVAAREVERAVAELTA